MKDVVWQPYGDYKEKSNIKRFMDKHKIKDYQELINRSTSDIEWFWDAALKDLDVEWFKPYDKILDTSKGIPWAKWFLGGKINIAHNCLDRHANSRRRNKVACIWESDDGKVEKWTFWDYYTQANKLANALEGLGIKEGDTIGLYMPMVPEIITILYACFKIGAIAIPIFSGYGASALSTRLNIGKTKLLFTADGYLRGGRKVEIKKQADEALKMAETVKKVVVYKRLGLNIPWQEKRDLWWDDLLANQPREYPTKPLASESINQLLFSSGTTGKPKGTVHTHIGDLAQSIKEVGYGFDLKEEDIFWWVTDIGWMMGPWLIFGTHHFGGTLLIFEGIPTYPQPDRLWEIIERQGVTLFSLSPTATRMLMRSGEAWVKKHDLSTLRILGSSGEAWDPESWMWFFENVGGKRCPIINISGGTEIFGCFLFPLPIMPQKPCTLGRGPALGMDVDVFDEEAKPIRGGKGYLVCKKPAPSMTKGFWGEPERYIETYWSKWPDIWFHSDWASVDEDGFWFLHGRADDVIKVAGRRVGPAEIEEVLIEHKAVSEAAVIGVPDEIKGEEIVAFVVLKPDYSPSDKLREEIKAQATATLGKTLRPAEVKFVGALPKTRSAKIVRGAIKRKYLGQEVGDISSVENVGALEEIGKAV